MLNKKVGIFYVKIHINKDKPFHLSFPIPLYILEELLDCIEDLLVFACILVPIKDSSSHPRKNSLHNQKELVQSTIYFLHACTASEPYDLVDVTTDHVNVTIRIR